MDAAEKKTVEMFKYLQHFCSVFVFIDSLLPVSSLPVVRGRTPAPKVSLATGIHGPSAMHAGPSQCLPEENKQKRSLT